MSVTAIGFQSPGGENQVSSQAAEATGTTDFLELLLEGSSPAEAHNAIAAGPVTGKLLSLLPDAEQGTETDLTVAIISDGAPGSVPAVAMAVAQVASTPGADIRAMGAPAPVALAAAVEAPGPSLPITALPSHVLGTDLAASGATSPASAGESPVDAAAPRGSVTSGAAPLVSLAHGLEPVDPATTAVPASVRALLDADAPTTTSAPAAAPFLPAAGADDSPGAPPSAPVASALPAAPSPGGGQDVAAIALSSPVSSPLGPAQSTGSAPVATPSATLQQVADALEVSIRRGDDVVRLQLRPAELGTVVIHLVQREGMLHAHVRADSPEAVQALQQALAGLADALGAQGQSLGGLDVALRQAHEERDFAARSQSPSSRGDDPAIAPDSIAALPAARPSTSAIDLRA